MLTKTSESPKYYDEENAVLGLYPMGKPMVSFGDYDADGDLDVISHPSNFIQTPLMQPIYWENIGNTYNPTALPFTTQFNRFSVDGDFNSDGYADSILIDTGLEGNNRDPDFFFGSNINYVKGSVNGPVNASSEITGTPNRNGVGSFNHIGDSGDVDGDGDSDLVVAAFGHLDIYLNNGLGQFSYASEQLVSPEARPDTTTFSLSNLAYSYSGVGFLENNENSTIVAGNYVHQDGAIESINNIDIYQKNTQGVYEIVQQLEKPHVSGYGKKYGVADIHGSDINGDGREDFLVSLETEVGNLNNLIVGVYLQNDNGSFDIAPDKTIELIDDGQKEVGIRLYDFNKDGYDDFSVSSYGFENINQSVWLNDRQGNFSPVNNDLLKISGLEDWQEPSLHWVDIDRDGSAEVIWQEKIYRDHPTPGGNYGEYLMVYENDTMFSRDRLYLEDLSIAFDLTGSAGQTAKTLAAVIGEEGLSNKEYVGIGLSLFDAGQSLATVCELALNAVGVTTNEDVVTTLYTNLYGESPSDDQLQEYVELLDQGVFTKGSLAAAAAELTDDLGVIDLVGLTETGIEYI